MKAFLTYTFAQFAVFAVTFGVVWLIASIFFETSSNFYLLVLLVALILSSVASIFLLADLRNKLALNVQQRAERMTERLEESRRYEAARGPALGAPARALPRISQGGACLGSRRGCARPRRSTGPMDVLWRSCTRWSRPAKG